MDNSVTKVFTVPVSVSPEEAAWIFLNGNSRYQAHVLNYIAEGAKKWANLACFQWRYMEEDLSSDAREMLREMYEHTDGILGP